MNDNFIVRIVAKLTGKNLSTEASVLVVFLYSNFYIYFFQKNRAKDFQLDLNRVTNLTIYIAPKNFQPLPTPKAIPEKKLNEPTKIK
jgi:hypothetical protein